MSDPLHDRGRHPLLGRCLLQPDILWRVEHLDPCLRTPSWTLAVAHAPRAWTTMKSATLSKSADATGVHRQHAVPQEPSKHELRRGLVIPGSPGRVPAMQQRPVERRRTPRSRGQDLLGLAHIGLGVPVRSRVMRTAGLQLDLELTAELPERLRRKRAPIIRDQDRRGPRTLRTIPSSGGTALQAAVDGILASSSRLENRSAYTR